MRRLQTDFIPFAGDMHELQNGHSSARDWFVQMAVKRNEQIRRGATAQGLYIAGPDGSDYGFLNHRYPDRVMGFMDRGLQEYRANRPGHVDTGFSDQPSTRLPESVASVVRVYSRIHPAPPGCDDKNRAVGRDHMWILAEEVRDIARNTGAGFPLPPTLVARIARFHLIDNVRGEPDMWDAGDVSQVTVLAQRLAGRANAFSFSGAFRMAAKNSSRGYEGQIEGEIEIDPGAARITRFRAYAEGKAWGAGQYTGGAPPGKFPLLIAIVDSNDASARSVAPQGSLWGDEYLHPRLALSR